MLSDYKNIQPVAYNILANEIKSNKLSHAYLFDVSLYDDNKFIQAFIKSILCQNHVDTVDSCNNCNICNAINDGNFPDIYLVESDGFTIKKEQLLELQKEFITKSLYNNKKIYIIKYAEHLNSASANSILKFLEEPEENIIAILLTKDLNSVVNTILSRCQIIKLSHVQNNDDSSDNKIKSILLECIGQDEIFNELDLDLAISTAVKFVEYYEKHGLDILSHTSNLWFEVFGDKKKSELGYNLLLLIYKDLLNVILGRSIEYFDEYHEILYNIANKNDLEALYKKIKVIIDTLSRNKLNVNLALNLDNMILRMEE